MGEAQDVPMLIDTPAEDVKTAKLVPTNKSGRWWKTVQTAKTSQIKKNKPLHSKWSVKMKNKADVENAKKLQAQIREQIHTENVEKAAKRKANEERRKANVAKSEVVQVIKNTEKLKRLKKKQMKNIKKMDTTELVQRTKM